MRLNRRAFVRIAGGNDSGSLGLHESSLGLDFPALWAFDSDETGGSVSMSISKTVLICFLLPLAACTGERASAPRPMVAVSVLPQAFFVECLRFVKFSNVVHDPAYS